MADKNITVRIKNRRDSNANWLDKDPIILNGELIIIDHETEGLKIKFGDGQSNYSSLPFYGTIYSEKPVYTYYEIQGLEEAINAKVSSIPIIPSGMIMIWSGSLENIPEGWVLCNGENGTPDLTDKFVLGAGGTYSTGDVGGEVTHTLIVEEIPTHNHSFQRHMLDRNDNGTNTGLSGYGVTNKTIDIYEATTESTGGGQAHNNMPPYYTLCYIMKI